MSCSFRYFKFKVVFKSIGGMRCCYMLRGMCSHSPDLANHAWVSKHIAKAYKPRTSRHHIRAVCHYSRLKILEPEPKVLILTHRVLSTLLLSLYPPLSDLISSPAWTEYEYYSSWKRVSHHGQVTNYMWIQQSIIREQPRG